MNLVYPNLYRKLNDTGITLSYLAEELNIPEKCVRQKMQGQLPWKLHEVVVVCRLLNYSDAKLLFVQ